MPRRFIFLTAGTTPPTPPGPSAIVKFFPGHCMLSGAFNGYPSSIAGGGGSNTSEFAQLVAASGGFIGWSGQYTWRKMEPTTLGVYPGLAGVDADFVNLQTAWANAGLPGGAIMNIFFCTYRYLGSYGVTPAGSSVGTPVNTTWTGNVPDYILNGSSGTYGSGPSGSSQNGWAPAQNYGGQSTSGSAPIGSATGDQFNYRWSWARKDNANVAARYLALFQALAARPVPTVTVGGVTYSGFTYSTHPLIGRIQDMDEYSIGYQNPLMPAGYSSSVEVTNWSNIWNGIAAAFPTNVCAGYNSYGNSASSTPISDVNSLQVDTLGTSPNFAMSDADTQAPFASFANPAQNLFAGNTFSNQTGTLVAGPGGSIGSGVDRRRSSPSVATVQGFDYGSSEPGCGPAPPGGDSQAVTTVQNIYADAIGNTTYSGSTPSEGLNANFIDWDTLCYTNYNNGIVWSNWWESILQPTIASKPVNSLLPTGLMVAPAAPTFTSKTSSSITISFVQQQTYTGTGLTGTLFRNGVAIATGIALSVTSHTDSGLANGSYTYKLAVSNANGTGPQSAGLTVSLP